MKVFILLCAVLTATMSMDPPLLAEKFTESFMLHDDQDSGSVLIPGQIWFDYQNKSQRIDMQNVLYLCQGMYPQQVPCTVIITNNTMYNILPKHNICCFIQSQIEIDRNLFENFTDSGTKSINGTSYYTWYQEPDFMVPDALYYTTKNQKKIPRRLSIGASEKPDKWFGFDFWPTSYAEKFNSANVFRAPSYCKKQCGEMFPNMQKPSSRTKKPAKNILDYLQTQLKISRKLQPQHLKQK